MMKMSRDRLKMFEQAKKGEADEDKLCGEIMSGIAAEVSAGVHKNKAADSQWEKMYELAALIMKNTIRNFMKQQE